MVLALSLPHLVASALGIALASLVAGYVWGRSTGLRDGQRLGRTAAPLELRESALEQGACPVCGQTLGATEPADHL